MERYYVKQEENVGKYEYLMEPGYQNEIEVMKMDGEDDGEDDGVTREAQQQKYKNAMLTDNMTPNDDSIGEKQHPRHESVPMHTRNPRQR